MAKVKQIINCETNKKYIKVYENGFINIPDIICYVLTADGKLHLWGDILDGDVPQIGKELEEDASLFSFIDGDMVNNLLAYYKQAEGNEVSAELKVDAFFAEMKRKLPYINVDKRAGNIGYRVKEIVSCETNKKFIQVMDEGNIFIPDVIYHVLTESGQMCLYGAETTDDEPRIGAKLPKWGGDLKGYINDSLIKGKFEYEKTVTEEDMAKRNVRDFLINLKRQVPLLGLEEDYSNTYSWMTI